MAAKSAVAAVSADRDYGCGGGPWGRRRKGVMADVVVPANRDNCGSDGGQGCWLGQWGVARTRGLILR